MLVPVNWLKDYVNIDIESKELADKLTMSGSHVDSLEKMDKGITKVVVGKINKIDKHPDADRLVVTTIDVGEEELQIVTGADNINEGDYVPIALVGARLPGGVKIKKSKLRGIKSYGMLCSAQELGISDNLVPKESKDGIFILDKEYELGKDIRELLMLDKEIIEFEITPNRPDCLSMIGMARETAATLNKDFNIPKIKINNEIDDISEYFNSVEVIDDDLCNRYYCKVVTNVKIQPSPLWMQMRLIQAGIRPINNIVDITNYVMTEFGQPLHAFDLEKIAGNKIVVRRANKNETMETLDGVSRNLDDSMLVIADDEKGVALAGVMGGADSEVTENTKTILVESANFDGRSVRLTSRAVGLRTEASSKFEKDLDPNLADLACNRVCQLIEQIGAGDVVKGYYDVYKNKAKKRIISLRIEKVKDLLGQEINKKQMIEILNRLELKAEENNDRIEVEIPTFRQDLKIEADLIEEVGRIYGFDKIPPKPLVGMLTKGDKSYTRIIEDISKEALSGMGLNEVMTYSFISPKAYDKVNLSNNSIKRRCVELINPLGEDYSVMRTTLIPNMMEVLSNNYKHGVDKAFAYEIGNIFTPKTLPINCLPYETKVACIGMYGKVDFYDVKGVIDKLCEVLGIKEYEYVPEENHSTFHPGRTANLVHGNRVIGTLGEIHPDVAHNYGMKERAYIAELDFEAICQLTNLEKKYNKLPKFPAVTRDIAVVLDDDIMVKEIEKIIISNGRDLVENVKFFDVYKGKQIPKGKKSVAYSITYRSYKKTLTDEEVNKVHDTIVNKLKEQLNASLR